MRKTNAKKYPKPRMELCSDPKVKICPLPVRRDAFGAVRKKMPQKISKTGNRHSIRLDTPSV